MNHTDITGIHLRHDRGAEFPDPAISSIIHEEDSKENNYNHFNRFNPQIQYRFMKLRGFIDRQAPRPALVRLIPDPISVP